LGSSQNPGNQAEQFKRLTLDAGTYYVAVLLQQESPGTRYALTMSAAPSTDRFGNSFETATPVSISATSNILDDAVGKRDLADLTQFTLTAPGTINLQLTNLSANANLELYDRNRNLINSSTNLATTGEAITQRLIEFGSTYYIRVVSPAGQDANYRLAYSLTPDLPTITGSGLKYVDLIRGTGTTPARGQTVVVHYTGTFENGTKFDSSRDRNRPFSFQLGTGSVIPGWDEGLSTMQVGGRRQLIVPANLAYGSKGVPGTIPPNSTLIFDVDLLQVV
jgi:hypothetical protein